MSIPCNNRVICTANNPQTLSNIEEWVSANLSDFCDIEMDDDQIHIHFNLDHDYGFPVGVMKQMTSQVPSDDTLYISVLTHDHSQEYIAHHEFKQCKWHCCYENAAHPLAERL